VTVGSNLVYTLTITNAGPWPATGVVISNQLPANVNFVSATGGATPASGVLLVNLGAIATGGTGSAQIVVQPTATGTLTNLFQVSADQTNFVPANAMATVATAVTSGSTAAELSLSASGSPSLVTAGSNLVYSLTVSNGGPATATGVVLGNQLPANVHFDFATGVTAVTATNGVLQLNLAPLAAGANQLVQITVQPNAAGSLTNRFQVSASQADLLPANNSATVATTVANAPVPPQVVLYNVYDLGGLGGSNSVARSVNNLGQIVGYSQLPGSGTNDLPVFWSNYLSSAVQLSNTGNTHVANSINYSSQIVGGEAGKISVASFWTNSGSTVFFLDSQSAPRSRAMSVNNGGQIVGGYSPAASEQPAFWTNSSSLLLALNPLGGAGGNGGANSINDSGQIVGATGPNAANRHATFWTNASSPAFDLGTLGGTKSVATSINAAGQIVGGALTPANSWQAAFWTNNSAPPLGMALLNGATNLATSINNRGQIVGVSGTSTNFFNPLGAVAIIWSSHNSPAQDLNSLIPANSGWVLLAATDLNDSGEIIGFGFITNNGFVPQLHAFALIPVTNADLSLGGTNSAVATYTEGVVYRLSVTNLGPSTATGVVVSNQIAAGFRFDSASDGAVPVNGVLLLNLGSLTPGAVTNVALTVTPTNYPVGLFTNVFRVFANEPDFLPANNSAALITQIELPTTQFTTSTAEYDSNHLTTVSQQLTNYSTELIAKMPNGTVVYDQTFTNAYASPAVQAAITTAAGDLTGAGASAYTGPVQTGFSLTTSNSSVTVPTGTNINIIAGTKQWVGPVTITLGNFGVVTGYTFDPVVTNYAIVTGGTNHFLTLGPGQTDFDTMLLSLFDFFQTTTITSNYLNSSVYVMTGVVSQASADLSLLASASTNPVYIVNGLAGSNLVYSVVVSNAGPATATGVVISNRPPGSFVSATGGATLTNGVLLLNLGSLAAGATNSAQIVVNMSIAGNFTNVFQVFANEFDPNPTNNLATVVSDVIGTNTTTTTTGAAEYDTTNTTIVSQHTTNYSTELIARLPNGTVVYDQTFTAAYADPTVQAAITTAAGDLTGAGAASYTGPTQTSFLKTTNHSSVTVPTSTNASVIFGSKVYIGPQTILVGNFGQIQGYTFDPVVTNYFIPTGWNGNPSSHSIPPGAQDIDTRVLSLVNILQTTTITSNYLNSAVYMMTGVVTQASADLRLGARAAPEPVTVGSNLTYTISITNHGSATATGVTVSNRIPVNASFVSATGGATPSGGVLLVNLGTLASNATTSAQIVVQPTVAGKLTNVFLVFADQADPVLTNNSATVVSTVTNSGTNTITTTVSTHTNDIILTSNLTQQVTNYSTELIAVMPGGTVLYDHTFNAAFSDPTVQAAVTTAAGDLTGAGATSYTGPTDTSSMQTSQGSSSVTMTNPVGSNVFVVTTMYVGPTNIFVGPNQSQPFTIPPGGVDFDTLTTTDETNLVTTTTRRTNLNSAVYEMTGIVARVDVALSIMAAPNPVNVGDPLTYSLTVTNNALTTATGVVVSNTLPPNVTLNSVLPSQGTVTTNGRLVKITVGNLPNGTAATIAIVAIPTAAGLLTNKATASSTQADSQPANNSVTNVTTAVGVPVTNLVLTVLSGITLNLQTGLFEQRVQVFNGGGGRAPAATVLVLVSGLAANATLYNAAGRTNGVPYVQSAGPLAVGDSIVFTLEYYVPTRVTPSHLTLTAEAGPPMNPPAINGTIMSISRTVGLPNGSVLVEFDTIPGRIYAVQYSSDMTTWLTAVPVIVAPANRTQWIDAGPPQTDVSPAQVIVRYYRVILLP